MIWYLYFAQRGHRFIKAGGSGDPLQRLQTLRSEARPVPVRLIGVVDRVASGLREADVHRALAPHRLAGEWYWPRAEVFDFIDDLLRRHGLPEFLHQQRLPRLTRGLEAVA